MDEPTDVDPKVLLNKCKIKTILTNVQQLSCIHIEIQDSSELVNAQRDAMRYFSKINK